MHNPNALSMKGVKMDKYLTPEIYNKYKQQVLDMSLGVEYYIGLEQQRESSCLSDEEIARRLGLSVEEVIEIRTIGENDPFPADTRMKLKGDKMDKYLTPEIYNKYKQQVLDMSLAVQYYVGLEQQRESSCLSDGEIAKRLGLSVEEVREIRTIAENDLLPADTWMKSDEEKRRKSKKFFSKRL
ncbi:hypothetical protein ACFLUR_04155 [Chloroflexota bacterium]